MGTLQDFKKTPEHDWNDPRFMQMLHEQESRRNYETTRTFYLVAAVFICILGLFGFYALIGGPGVMETTTSQECRLALQWIVAPLLVLALIGYLITGWNKPK